MPVLSRLTPARRRGHEVLDESGVSDDARERAMRDLERSNRYLGGTRALLAAAGPVLARAASSARNGEPPLVLDVGAGTGDLSVALRREASRRGATLRIVGVDVAATLLRANAGRFDAALGADVLRLPVRDDSADVVCCSQLLHHFEGVDARSLVGELQRAARPGGSVVLSDLRRSHVAAAGFLLASWAMHFDSITRHDGVVSVYRGFTADELRDLISGVTGVTPEVRKRAFWRVTAVWTKPCR